MYDACKQIARLVPSLELMMSSGRLTLPGLAPVAGRM